mgnify:CR=1 FL=1
MLAYAEVQVPATGILGREVAVSIKPGLGRRTEIRRAAGLDAARAVLGHSSPVVTEVYAAGEPPIVAAEVAGSVSERALLDLLYAGKAKLSDLVEEHMGEQLPSIGSNEPVADAVAALENADALLVQEDGKPVGVVTRQDLLTYIARG